MGNSMARSHASGSRHSRGIGREQLEGVSRLRGHISSIMRISVPAVHLVGLNVLLRELTICLHREEQRGSCITVGLGQRKKRGPGVARSPKSRVRVVRVVRHASYGATCLAGDNAGSTLGREPAERRKVCSYRLPLGRIRKPH